MHCGQPPTHPACDSCWPDPALSPPDFAQVAIEEQYVQVWADSCGFQGHHEAFVTKIRRCRQAKEIFEYCNLRMVAKIAHRYVAQGVEMEVSR